MISAVHYAFDPQNKPLQEVKPGDALVFKTMDCFSNEITCESDLTTNFRYDRANPASGPVFVTGAEPGDILVAEINKIAVADQGVATTLPGVGPLCDFMEIRTKVIPIKNGMAQFNGLSLPIRPMIGVIGVAPESGSVPCGFPGSHGGNLDCKLMNEGAKAYFPVRVPGALFQLGDLHAVMGDAEICGTGLEIAGEVTVTLRLIKNKPLDWPILETADKWYAMASSLDYTEALKNATRQLQLLITDVYGWDATDVFFYLSLWGDAELNQASQPCPVPMIVRVGAPKMPDKPLLSY